MADKGLRPRPLDRDAWQGRPSDRPFLAPQSAPVEALAAQQSLGTTGSGTGTQGHLTQSLTQAPGDTSRSCQTPSAEVWPAKPSLGKLPSAVHGCLPLWASREGPGVSGEDAGNNGGPLGPHAVRTAPLTASSQAPRRGEEGLHRHQAHPPVTDTFMGNQSENTCSFLTKTQRKYHLSFTFQLPSATRVPMPTVPTEHSLVPGTWLPPGPPAVLSVITR